MTSREALNKLFNEANRLSCEEPKYTTHELWEMCKQILKDLEALELLKKYFESYGWTNGIEIAFWGMPEVMQKKVKEILKK